MGTLRRHAHIARPADAVWRVIADVGAIADWFPSMTESRVTDRGRWVQLASGLGFDEEIVTCDPHLRRLQYRIEGGFAISEHLATVDVIDDERGGCVVVYSSDVRPDAMTFVLGGAIGEAVSNLKAVLEEEV